MRYILSKNYIFSVIIQNNKKERNESLKMKSLFLQQETKIRLKILMFFC